MATSTMTTTTTPTGTTVATTESWLKQHERIVILSLILLFCGWGLSKYYDVEAARADAKNVAAQQLLAQAKENSAAQAQATALVTQQYAALVQSLSMQNANLAASITQRTASQKAQTAVDVAATPSELTARWTALVPTVQALPNGNLISTNVQGVRDTVVQLESVPVLTQNLKDETTVAQNYQAEVQKSNELITDLNTQVAGLKTLGIDQTNACKTQVADVKAQARKGKVKWFKIGFVTGFLTRQIIKTETGW